MSLAVADFISLLMFGLNGVTRGHFRDHLFTARFEVFVYFPVCVTSTTASILLIVCVTCERHIALTRPVFARNHCTPATARKLVVAVWLLSCLVNLPRWFVFELDTSGELARTSFGGSDVYAVLAWVYFVVFTVGCSVSLLVLNTLLIRGLRRASAKRRLLTTRERSRNDDVRLTRMLIAVVIIFLAGELPSAIFSRLIVAAVARKRSAPVMAEDWYMVCVCVATICVVTQHSLNFVCYCAFNKRFRCEFRRMFCASATPTSGAYVTTTNADRGGPNSCHVNNPDSRNFIDNEIDLKTM